MKTHKVILHHSGEQSGTPKSPIKVYTDDHGLDLKAQQRCILNSDDWRIVMVDKYAVDTIDLPDWIDIDRYIYDPLSFEFLLRKMAIFKIDPDTLTIGAATKLMAMPTKDVFACLSLLKVKNFRSEFRASLRGQLDEWLETDENTFDSPFSYKQWECLLNNHIITMAARYDRYGA